MEIEIQQRDTDGFFNATELLAIYNSESETKKRFKDFWENISTKNICSLLMSKLGVSKLHESTRGRGGATWMHKELMDAFCNWLYKLPNQTFTREEISFVNFIKDSFDGVLEFCTQEKFGQYYVDLYCPEIKLCIEFDEEYHNKQTERDKVRQREIEEEYDVEFIRQNINEEYSRCVNKIIKYKMAYNVVQRIKSNKVPSFGLL